MIQDLFIIGATGKVGRALVNQIITKKDIDATLHTNPTRIVGIASSTHFIYSPKGIEPEQAFSFSKNRNFDNTQTYDDLHELSRAVNNSKNEESSLVFVDATALNEPMTKFHLHIIRDTSYSFVTANKNPIALSDYSIFTELIQNPRRYGYRCSVMAGAESVTFLQDLRDLNDKLHVIEGCFSGTNGYIATELEKGRKFSDILGETKEKGYTEPDPRDDLSGLDVARKLVVLARTAGYDIGLNDVVLKPFIPKGYFKEESVESFLSRARELDISFKEMVNQAQSKEMTLRYVARLDVRNGKPNIEVSLREVPMKSPLGYLEGTSNKFVVITDTYPQEKPYSIEAPGAGLEVTARNIRRDLLYLLPERKSIL